MIGRRGFITGLISLVAAPAIVRVGIMPVKVIDGDVVRHSGILYRAMPSPVDLAAEMVRQFDGLAIYRSNFADTWGECARYFGADR